MMIMSFGVFSSSFNLCFLHVSPKLWIQEVYQNNMNKSNSNHEKIFNVQFLLKERIRVIEATQLWNHTPHTSRQYN